MTWLWGRSLEMSNDNVVKFPRYVPVPEPEPSGYYFESMVKLIEGRRPDTRDMMLMIYRRKLSNDNVDKW